MTKWQYKEFGVPIGTPVIPWLNSLGEDGWELVGPVREDRGYGALIALCKIALCKRQVMSEVTADI